MSFLTLGAAKATVARALGMCSTDTRVTDLVNEAQERLLNRPNQSVGSLVRYRFCINESCIVLPRQIRTVESFALCDTPGIVRPIWHEFLGNGTYLYSGDKSIGNELLDHGRTATFNDVGSGKSVTAIAVTAGGSGYTSAPTVVITNDSTDTTGAGALATAVLTGDAVTSVTITNSGSGYVVAPTISFTGGAGTGATATATIAFNRLIRALSSTAADDTGLVVTVMGYDETAQWVRTKVGLVWIDGEQITLAGTAVNTTTTFTKVVKIVKPVTSGRVDMWTWDSTASIEQRQIGAYEPSETLPTYRKMLFPGLSNYGTCSSATSSCEDKSLTVLARLRHVPVSVDNDFLIIDNLGAIKTMCMAIQREEQNRLQEAESLEVKAIREIDGELSAYNGDGAKYDIKHVDGGSGGMGVFNPI